MKTKKPSSANSTTATSSTTPATIGQRIKAQRKKRGIPQKTLAELLRVDVSTISRWESDERQPFWDMVQQLATELKVSPHYLMYGIDYSSENYVDLGGLTFRQANMVRWLVEEFRKNC